MGNTCSCDDNDGQHYGQYKHLPINDQVVIEQLLGYQSSGFGLKEAYLDSIPLTIRIEECKRWLKIVNEYPDLLTTPLKGKLFVDIIDKILNCIRYGIPDRLKAMLLPKVGGSSYSYGKELYKISLQKVFGDIIPDKFERHVPTFSAGFEGSRIAKQYSNENIGSVADLAEMIANSTFVQIRPPAFVPPSTSRLQSSGFESNRNADEHINRKSLLPESNSASSFAHRPQRSSFSDSVNPDISNFNLSAPVNRPSNSAMDAIATNSNTSLMLGNLILPKESLRNLSSPPCRALSTCSSTRERPKWAKASDTSLFDAVHTNFIANNHAISIENDENLTTKSENPIFLAPNTSSHSGAEPTAHPVSAPRISRDHLFSPPTRMPNALTKLPINSAHSNFKRVNEYNLNNIHHASHEDEDEFRSGESIDNKKKCLNNADLNETCNIDAHENQTTPLSAPHVAHNALSIDNLANMMGKVVGEGRLYILETVAPISEFLSEEGRISAKRLLWVFSEVYGSSEVIEFCPLIPTMVCLLLIFLDESQVFCIVNSRIVSLRDAIKHVNLTPKTSMIQQNVPTEKASDGGAPSLFLSRDHFLKFVTETHCRLASPTTSSNDANIAFVHLQRIGVDILGWIAHGLENGFVSILPIGFVVRLYIICLFEGVEIFSGVACALLSYFSKAICSTKDQIEAEMLLDSISKPKSDGRLNLIIRDYESITKLAFQMMNKAKKRNFSVAKMIGASELKIPPVSSHFPLISSNKSFTIPNSKREDQCTVNNYSVSGGDVSAQSLNSNSLSIISNQLTPLHSKNDYASAFSPAPQRNKHPLLPYNSTDKLNHYGKTPYLKPSSFIRQFARPRLLATRGDILSIEYWERIWSWLPRKYHTLTPRLLFSTSKHGTNLKHLYRLCEKEKINKSMLLFVRTTHGEIIGCFTPMLLSSPQYRNNTEYKKILLQTPMIDSFVFSLNPLEMSYQFDFNSESDARQVLTCTNHGIAIGSRDAALTLDANLRLGSSRPSATFRSPQLNINPFLKVMLSKRQHSTPSIGTRNHKVNEFVDSQISNENSPMNSKAKVDLNNNYKTSMHMEGRTLIRETDTDVVDSVSFTSMKSNNNNNTNTILNTNTKIDFGLNQTSTSILNEDLIYGNSTSRNLEFDDYRKSAGQLNKMNVTNFNNNNNNNNVSTFDSNRSQLHSNSMSNFKSNTFNDIQSPHDQISSVNHNYTSNYTTSTTDNNVTIFADSPNDYNSIQVSTDQNKVQIVPSHFHGANPKDVSRSETFRKLPLSIGRMNQNQQQQNQQQRNERQRDEDQTSVKPNASASHGVVSSSINPIRNYTTEDVVEINNSEVIRQQNLILDNTNIDFQCQFPVSNVSSDSFETNYGNINSNNMFSSEIDFSLEADDTENHIIPFNSFSFIFRDIIIANDSVMHSSINRQSSDININSATDNKLKQQAEISNPSGCPRITLRNSWKQPLNLEEDAFSINSDTYVAHHEVNQNFLNTDNEEDASRFDSNVVMTHHQENLVPLILPLTSSAEVENLITHIAPHVNVSEFSNLALRYDQEPDFGLQKPDTVLSDVHVSTQNPISSRKHSKSIVDLQRNSNIRAAASNMTVQRLLSGSNMVEVAIKSAAFAAAAVQQHCSSENEFNRAFLDEKVSQQGQSKTSEIKHISNINLNTHNHNHNSNDDEHSNLILLPNYGSPINTSANPRISVSSSKSNLNSKLSNNNHFDELVNLLDSPSPDYEASIVEVWVLE